MGTVMKESAFSRFAGIGLNLVFVVLLILLAGKIFIYVSIAITDQPPAKRNATTVPKNGFTEPRPAPVQVPTQAP